LQLDLPRVFDSFPWLLRFLCARAPQILIVSPNLNGAYRYLSKAISFLLKVEALATRGAKRGCTVDLPRFDGI
jgi:hypothetical protein